MFPKVNSCLMPGVARLWGAGLLAWAMLAVVGPGGAAELAPMPRKVVSAIGLKPIDGGFQLALSKPVAQTLSQTLDLAANEQEITQLLRDCAELRKQGLAADDPLAAARLELLALVISRQLPAFKTALREKMGANGVVIQVKGLQRPRLFSPSRPFLEFGVKMATRIVVEVTPEEVGQTLAAVQAIARTTPLHWTVLPQE